MGGGRGGEYAAAALGVGVASFTSPSTQVLICVKGGIFEFVVLFTGTVALNLPVPSSMKTKKVLSGATGVSKLG